MMFFTGKPYLFIDFLNGHIAIAITVRFFLHTFSSLPTTANGYFPFRFYIEWNPLLFYDSAGKNIESGI